MKSGLIVAVMAAVTTAVTATLVVVLVNQPFAPEQLDAAAPATAAAVTSQQFVDDRPVNLAVTLGQPTEITIPVAGRVTALACAPAGAVESGSSPVAINGSPVLALSLGTPPWRDLAVGDKGSDVTALQAELARLGHDVSADRDRVGAATVAAFRAVAAAQGLTVERGAPLPLASVVWLRAPSVTVGACDLTDGDVVEAGATLASTPIPLVAARVSAMPSMLAAGDRAVTVDRWSFPSTRPVLSATQQR